MKQEHITSDLWKIRIYFALYLGAGGFLYPFLSLYYKQIGLTGTQMGLLASLGWTISMLFAPLWGRWGDTAHRPKLILQIALIGAGLSNLFLGLQSTFLTIALFIAIGSFLTTHSVPFPLPRPWRLPVGQNQALAPCAYSVRLDGQLRPRWQGG